MNFKELQEKVFLIWYEEGLDSGDFGFKDYHFYEFLKYGSGRYDTDRVVFITKEGGGEGGTEDVFSVINVDGVLYRVNYSYRSYDGYEFDYAEVSIVKPVDRMVTFYEEI
ncbi:hypothetical protein D3C87_325310 [compost metagenome]